MRTPRQAFVAIATALLGFGLIFAAAGRGLAQEATPEPVAGRPAHIHVGTCATLDPNPAFPLTNVAAPTGTAAGAADATPVEISFTTVPVDLATLQASDYAINVHLSAEEADVYVACGEIGGIALDQAGALAIGLREQNDSGLSGIAYLAPNAADPTQTDVSLFLAEGLAGAGAGGVEDETTDEETTAATEVPTPTEQATAEATEMTEATLEATDEAAAEGEVAVSLADFSIDMPTELPAGPTTFVITNDGSTTHSFEIESEELGIEEELDESLDPNGTTTFEIDLEPGTYVVYCPIGNHRELGMELELTVTG